MDPLDQVGDPTRGQYGVLKLQTSPLGNDSAGGSADLANGKYFIEINFYLKLKTLKHLKSIQFKFEYWINYKRKFEAFKCIHWVTQLFVFS